MSAQSADIGAWLAAPAENTQAFDAAFRHAVGMRSDRGAAAPVEAFGVRVVLRLDATRPEGYVILTAYPI